MKDPKLAWQHTSQWKIKKELLWLFFILMLPRKLITQYFHLIPRVRKLRSVFLFFLIADARATLLYGSMNEQVISGSYHNLLKVAGVTPVSKSGTYFNLKNYRTTLIFVFINKVFERASQCTSRCDDLSRIHRKKVKNFFSKLFY